MEQLKGDRLENEKIEVLLEMLFTEEEKTVYRERYDENSRKLEEESKRGNEKPLEVFEFAETVNFSKNKHTIGEFSGVARENCGGYIDTIRETREALKGEQLRGEGLEENKNSEKGEKDD